MQISRRPRLRWAARAAAALSLVAVTPLTVATPAFAAKPVPVTSHLGLVLLNSTEFSWDH